MDIFEIVRSLRHISEIKYAVSPPKLLLDRTIADAQILIDPQRVTPFPSSSGNTVAFVGTEQPISRDDAAALVDLYTAHGVPRFFVSLSPSPWLQQNIEALAAVGLTQFRGPDYHTLLRNMADPIINVAQSDFRIERVTPDSPHSLDTFDPSAKRASGLPEFDVWAAMAGETTAGWGMATTAGAITYLGGAATSEPYRNKGAQTALIHARLQDAESRGSQIAVSETLSMLGSSLRNLQRAGFKITYDKLVYQYGGE